MRQSLQLSLTMARNFFKLKEKYENSKHCALPLYILGKNV